MYERIEGEVLEGKLRYLLERYAIEVDKRRMAVPEDATEKYLKGTKPFTKMCILFECYPSLVRK